jgi:small-conductance mechanosensitive channel
VSQPSSRTRESSRESSRLDFRPRGNGDPSVLQGVPRWKRPFGCVAAGLLLSLLLAAAPAHAQQEGEKPKPAPSDQEHELPSASVEVDGRPLFRVRGTTAFPADKRAQAIAERIKAAAAKPDFKVDDLNAAESEIGTVIQAGRERVLIVTEADARLEGIGRRVLATAYVERIRETIVAYRSARTREALTKSAFEAAAALVAFAVAVALIVWLWRRVHAALEQRYRSRVHSVGIQSFQILRAERIWLGLRAALNTVRTAVIVVLAFTCFYVVLSRFPWTRGTASRLLEYVIDPLETMGAGVVASIPALLFLAILYVITRYLLKLIHLFFAAVGRREVTLEGFDAEWADPTYKLVRLAVVVLALVVAYPYIPGSGSDAFKGLSLFIGIVFSLGSSSAIANMIAGYMMTYRRAFKLGDRVKIGGFVGDVTEMRLQVTHLKTVKNEEVVIPNSSILNNEVVNYSSLAKTQGLILHTTVGIGYETPWRQVEAMLLEAARRTSGLAAEPAPFVRQQSLGDFAVTYELNVYCGDAHAMGALYTDLHRNILDAFNEYGVQIMTPAYEGDTPEPKVVPRDKWFLAPASPGAAHER